MRPNDLQTKIDEYEIEFGFKKRVYCSDDQNVEFKKIVKKTGELPEGVYYEKVDGDYEFFTVEDNQVSEDKKMRLLMYESALNIRTLKKCILFLTGVVAAELIAGVIWAIVFFVGMKG